MAGSTKVAIVTGSNKGIGLAIVRRMCKEFSGDVILTARDDSRGRAAVSLLEGEGLQPKFHQLDIDSRDSIATLKESIEKNYGGVDVLVNNAAIGYQQPAGVSWSDHVTATINTNFTSTLNLTRSLLPLMRPHGRIVMVSSMDGTLDILHHDLQEKLSSDSLTEAQLVVMMDEFIQDAIAGNHMSKGWSYSPYAVSKAGLNALTRVLCREISSSSQSSVIINTCCPGWVRTDMGGEIAPLDVTQGAETPVYLAMLPPGSPSGVFWEKKRKIEF